MPPSTELRYADVTEIPDPVDLLEQKPAPEEEKKVNGSEEEITYFHQ